MTYVDGFVLPVSKKKLAAYRAMAKKASRVWKDLGALEYCEAAGDDLKPKGAAVTFPKMARVRAGETVVFAWITYRSRAHRDRVMAKIMKDPRIIRMMKGTPPFDYKRMAYAGFRTIVKI
jgi:uncharacterized protein YbaA (DUF1428 family)